MAPRTKPHCHPPDAGAQRQVSLLAVCEVALVEQPDILQARAPSEHQRPVWMAGVLPTLCPGGGREDAAEVRVDDRCGVVADIRARKAGSWTFGEGIQHPAQAVLLGSASCGRESDPTRRGIAFEEVAEPEIGTGPEAQVATGVEHHDIRPLHLEAVRSRRCRRRRS